MLLESMLLAGNWLLLIQGPKGTGPVVRDRNAYVLLGFMTEEKHSQKGGKGGSLPHATVEVTAVSEKEAEAIRSFTRWIAPSLQEAAVKGYDNRESVQLLGEFMQQDPSHPRPPSVGRFHYNVFTPASVPQVSR